MAKACRCPSRNPIHKLLDAKFDLSTFILLSIGMTFLNALFIQDIIKQIKG